MNKIKIMLCLFVTIITFFVFLYRVSAISDISINNVSLIPIFDKNTKTYNAFVDDNKEIITINVFSENDEYVTGAGSKSLKRGINKFYINSYYKDTLIDSYLINITRGNIAYDKSNAYLDDLKISGFDIEFKSNVFDYYIECLDEFFLDISYTLSNPKASANMKGDVFLNKKENTITIEVLSEDKKNKQIYTIHANKKVLLPTELDPI